MEERLQKIISARGVASRRAAESMIAEGRVSVNGTVAETGMKADPEHDEICIDGVLLPPEQKNVYIMLNKPRGYVTTASDERGRKTVMELVENVGVRVYPVGRLDMDSEGLLLLTNDGEFANMMMHPSNEKTKTYIVSVRGNTENAEMVSDAIEIDGKMTLPAKVEVLREEKGGGVISVTIHEGRNRQVRRLCEHAGLEVRRLKRVSVGDVSLGTLRTGMWRHLTKQEIDSLILQR